jgi:prepilin-type N-terminal cleavage/methylation domain-containing protein
MLRFVNRGRLGWRERSNCPRAFTLIELLVVLSIIGLLAAMTLPKLKSVRQGNALVAAGRQLVDDLALARAKAIGERTVVHMIFVPTNVLEITPSGDARNDRTLRRLQAGAYTTYALFAERSVGDQPGHRSFRYLTQWKTLPEGIFVAPWKFIEDPARLNAAATNRPFAFDDFPFPTSAGDKPLEPHVPHIAFDEQGAPIVRDPSGNRVIEDEYIPLARGSIMYSRVPNGNVTEFDVRESPPNNSIENFHRVRVDGLTGRSKVETLQITP